MSTYTHFQNCFYLKAAPRISAEYYRGRSTFLGCESMIVAPALYTGESILRGVFEECDVLEQPAVIQNFSVSAQGMYTDCPALKWPVSIPPNITSISYIYENCTNVTGEFILRGNPTKTSALEGTTKELIIYGDQTRCQALAATADNGNARWEPWYDPVPAVTDRGQGTYTTATDMTRMVRNGALAVATYAPGRMRYQQNDIVREDEWKALVAAAQTIDPTVTLSTHYSNLNKIEAAFDSAL